ncbi:hypothetical protein EHQ58_04170 [Leptospira ognonensis]|uniref:Uncharacterized protein n=1 Tax=Leptospira ognonensis TaxID=2484945 RepID=A0A4R9K819_9LEPT|nr:hypothetical protein [Leptospira ognonensis]TGL61817.1 hypothetical protein EHQ58_04170 [Leptospira ognonensis]
MFWKDILNQSDEFLNDPNNIRHFSLKGHPEYPNLSTFSEEDVLAMLTEFLEAEKQSISIKNLLNYSPFYEMILSKQNIPSIYG